MMRWYLKLHVTARPKVHVLPFRKFQRQFFKNNALPGFVLTTDNILSKRVKERLLESWRASYTTIFDGARNPAILDGGLKIDEFSTKSFDQLDFENVYAKFIFVGFLINAGCYPF